MRTEQILAKLTIAVGVLLVSAATHASESLQATCESEIRDTHVCDCASEKLRDFLGKQNYKKYAAFMVVFAERHAQQIERGGDSLSAWNGAMSRYAREAGEEPFAVMSWVPDFERVHRYALTACGARVPATGREQSLFFFGDA